MQSSLYFFYIHCIAVGWFMFDNNLSTETEEHLIEKTKRLKKGFLFVWFI